MVQPLHARARIMGLIADAVVLEVRLEHGHVRVLHVRLCLPILREASLL